jgi:hypothetical protein
VDERVGADLERAGAPWALGERCMRVVVMVFAEAKPSREHAGDTTIHRNATMASPKHDVTDRGAQEASGLASKAGAGRRQRLETPGLRDLCGTSKPRPRVATYRN